MLKIKEDVMCYPWRGLSKLNVLEWPTDDDTFFGEGLDAQFNAVLDYGWSQDISQWDTHVSGFGDAAKELVRCVLDGKGFVDTFVYPIVFLYLHHFELGMKTIIALGCQFLDRPIRFEKTHRLICLWANTRCIIEDVANVVGEGGYAETNETVQRLFQELRTVDVDSVNIRYPVTPRGQESLPNLKLFNIQHFASTATKVANYFSCCSTWVGTLLRTKWDMESEMRF